MKVPGKAMLCRVNVFCICRLPDAGDNMIKCSHCSASFHCACIEVAEDVVPYTWLFTACGELDFDSNL